MHNAEISTKLADVEFLIGDCKVWAANQPNSSLAAHLATYINVYLLGVLEESFELLFGERARKANDDCVANYICQNIDRSFQNPKRDSIGEMLRRFSSDFSEAFYRRFSKNCPEITALHSINFTKRDLAHKGAYSLNLTLEDVESYLTRVIPILEEVESILG